MLRKNRKEETFKGRASRSISPEPNTIIGVNVFIEGSIRGEGDLVIEGTVKGKIELAKHHLTVGPNGQVEAQIQAGNVTVSGNLIGNIEALDKVTITKGADLNGEIKAKRISVEDGAMLKAAIELERESQIKDLPKFKPAEEVSPAPQDELLALAASKGVKGK